MKNKMKMALSIGGPTIIMIFVVLSLTTLGTLSLVTANADWKLTEKTVASTNAYYLADNSGEMFLAEVDALLLAEEPLAKLNQLAATSAVLNPDNSINIIHTIEINSAQKLVIKLLLPRDQKDSANSYQIESWQVVNNAYWNYDDFEIQFDDTIPEGGQ